MGPQFLHLKPGKTGCKIVDYRLGTGLHYLSHNPVQAPFAGRPERGPESTRYLDISHSGKENR